MTNQEKEILETFFQFGDLKNANIVFVGLEEGLGSGSVNEAILARKLLFEKELFIKHRVFINEIDYKEGWYIDNALCLDQARNYAEGKNIEDLSKLKPDYSKTLTMKMQARLHWLITGNNRTDSYSVYSSDEFKNYEFLNIPGSKSAMIDIYPFPKVNANNWPEQYKAHFYKKKQYYNYYNQNDNPRIKIIKKVYDKYSLKNTIGYAGILKGNFKLKSLYELLGFKFNGVQFTNMVHPDYSGPIKQSLKPKPFVIGKRTNPKGNFQKVILTPFFGNGQVSINDIEVISTWIE